MRVIAGTAKGTKLAAPTTGVRPTSDRVKEAIFSILGPMEGLEVIDGYAGSGSLGIEALSRGAESCVFIERNKRSREQIVANLVRAHLSKQATIVPKDVVRYFMSTSSGKADIILLDPPYDAPSVEINDTMRACLNVAKVGARIILECSKRREIDAGKGLVQLDERIYGDTKVLILGSKEKMASD